MANFAHLVYVPFTGVGVGNASRQPNWYAERIEIFKNFTLKSLQNQTNQNFILWLSFRPEEETNPLTAELADYLKAQDVNYVLTFDGLMYWDDKFTSGVYNRLKNCARIVRSCWRNRAWSNLWSSTKELWEGKNETLPTRLHASLSLLSRYFSQTNWIYLTRLDSDDMLEQSVIEQIQIHPQFPGAIVMEKGYIYNKDTQELAEYSPKTNPPFHTILFPSPIFFTPYEHMKYMAGFKSHEDIPKVFEISSLGNGNYCVLTHNPKNHISTTFDHPYRGQTITEPMRHLLLKSFGL